jgi:predicted dehydrogenase
VTFRVAQVGLGSWGLDWATSVIPQVPNVQLVGVVSRNPARLPDITRRLRCAEASVFKSLEDLLASTDVDGVLITTQTSNHAQLIHQALTAEKHVLVEKPFVSNLVEAKMLAELARSLGRVLMVSQNYRFFPAARRAAELVQKKICGNLHHVSVDFRRSVARGDSMRAEWLSRQSQPLLMDLGIHHFDLMRMIIGTPAQRVYCSAGSPSSSQFLDPSSGTAIIDFEGGVTVTWNGTWEAPGDETTYSGNWRLDCEKAEIHWTCRGDRDITLDGDSVRIIAEGRELSSALPIGGLFGRAAGLKAFVAAATGDHLDPYLPQAADNVQSLALTIAAVESAKTNKVVHLTHADS